MKKICIIPARAGSKRIKNKNLKELSGKPLVSWSIECALSSGIFDKIILSTDSEDIAKIGKFYGLNTALRPTELAGDYTTAEEVISYHIEGRANEKVCYLQPTSPLRNKEDINLSLELMEKKQAYSVISMCKLERPENWIYNAEENFEEFVRNISKKRSQDHKLSYVLNGALYWFESKEFKKYKTHLIPHRSYPYIMPINRSVDIDSPEDFIIAEILMNKIKNTNRL